MLYEINKHYPISEYGNIAEWWQDHREYNINEIREPREYVVKPITETDPETGDEVVVGEEDVLVERDYDDYVEIVRRSNDLIIEDLRMRREYECFPYINRGSLWYDTLETWQQAELMYWYRQWLNVTETLVVPTKPEWLK